MRYLKIEQLKTNLSLGRSVEQLLPFEKRDDYVILKWLSIDKQRDLTYDTNYFECFDDGDEDFIDIVEFSYLNPDEPFITNNFETIDEALDFVVNTYSASLEKFVTGGGMIAEDYKDYLKTRKS